MRESSNFSLGFLYPYPIRHYIHFYVTYLHALMQVDHHSFFLSICLLLSLFYSSISLYLIWFLFFLILLDVWLGFGIHTLFLLIWYVIHLLSFFMWESLGLQLMMFSMHCISCMRGMGIISLGLLSLVSFCFFHPITLAYVTSQVLRPLWDHNFTHCVWQLTHGQYSRLVGDYFLGAWWMGSRGDGLH